MLDFHFLYNFRYTALQHFNRSSAVTQKNKTAVVANHHSTYKSINNNIPQIYLQLIFHFKIMTFTSSPSHSLNDGSALHYSFNFEKHLTQAFLS